MIEQLYTTTRDPEWFCIVRNIQQENIKITIKLLNLLRNFIWTLIFWQHICFSKAFIQISYLRHKSDERGKFDVLTWSTPASKINFKQQHQSRVKSVQFIKLFLHSSIDQPEARNNKIILHYHESEKQLFQFQFRDYFSNTKDNFVCCCWPFCKVVGETRRVVLMPQVGTNCWCQLKIYFNNKFGNTFIVVSCGNRGNCSNGILKGSKYMRTKTRMTFSAFAKMFY